MKERGILFSAPMVRALLAGSKTQTRRVCKPAQAAALSCVVEVPDPAERGQVYNGSTFGDEDGEVQFSCPFGGRGDRLWVRETWMADPVRDGTWPHMAFDGCKPRDMSLIPERYRSAAHCLYRADGHSDLAGWTPAIHMFRWASRILLEITDVRVERLQDISEADAVAEGCALECMTPTGDDMGSAIHNPGGYLALWESINGTGAWDANPWVWAITFKRID